MCKQFLAHITTLVHIFTVKNHNYYNYIMRTQLLSKLYVMVTRHLPILVKTLEQLHHGRLDGN